MSIWKINIHEIIILFLVVIDLAEADSSNFYDLFYFIISIDNQLIYILKTVLILYSNVAISIRSYE